MMNVWISSVDITSHRNSFAANVLTADLLVRSIGIPPLTKVRSSQQKILVQRNFYG